MRKSSSFGRRSVLWFLAVTLALAGPLPASGASQVVPLPNGKVLRYGGTLGCPSSLTAIEESTHNGQSAVHNALWCILTARESFNHDDSVIIYNYALSPEGRSELIRAMNGNNGWGQEIPYALSNFNDWATRSGFQAIAISQPN